MSVSILILCTGNSCRSQMAEAILKEANSEFEVFSAGTNPADQVHPKAIVVMNEIGIDISSYSPQDVSEYISKPFTYVITVCDNARESCPVFTGEVEHQIHMGFEDPAEATGSEEEIMTIFRTIRDEIKTEFTEFAAKI